MQSYTINNVRNLYESRQKIINLRNDNAKKLSPKQILRILPIALAQVKAGNNSESLLNEIGQIVYCFYQSTQITKKYTIV